MMTSYQITLHPAGHRYEPDPAKRDADPKYMSCKWSKLECAPNLSAAWYRCLSPKGKMVTAHLKNGPCREMFDRLAEFAPYDLLALVQRGAMSNAAMTFATETLGRTGLREALPVLGALALWHRSPVVREGALLGLLALESDGYESVSSEKRPATITGFIALMARQDNSPILREMANDSLYSVFSGLTHLPRCSIVREQVSRGLITNNNVWDAAPILLQTL